MRVLTDDERDILRPVNGLYEGQLDTEELDAFNVAVSLGLASRAYDGVQAVLGLARVKLHLERWNTHVSP